MSEMSTNVGNKIGYCSSRFCRYGKLVWTHPEVFYGTL